MDCCYAHCACCAHRPRSRERPRGLYFVPLRMGVFIDEDDYELEPLDLHPYHYFPRVLPPRRSPRWSRRMKEEEEEEEMLKSLPRRFSCFEENARNKKMEASENSEEEHLQGLAHRLEALELGLERLIGVISAPTPQNQRPQWIGSTDVARSIPPTDGFPRPQNTPRSEAIEKVFCEKKTFVMDPEEAAVIIQSRFRAYLVRRSQTLRHLQDLAMVKSTLKELHCLYADSRYRKLLCRDADERNLFSERATALLLKVDSIQGCEPLVREARRSLSKDLVTLLDSLDGMGVRSAQRRKSSNCIDCSGEVAIPAEDEEEMEESQDRRIPPSERRYFPRPLCNSNRGRYKHGSRHCKWSDFDASIFDKSKMRIPFICRKKFGSPGHLLRDKITGIDGMDEVGFGSYCPSAALPS